MATILKRKVGETGNPIAGRLINSAGTLTLPEGAVVTLNAWRLDTGDQVITDAAVTILDRDTASVRYDLAADDLADALSGVTLDLEFTITPDSGRPTFVPDTDDDDLLLVVLPRHGSV